VALAEVVRGGKKVWRTVSTVDTFRGSTSERVVLLRKVTPEERQIFEVSHALIYDLDEVLDKAWRYDGLCK
jgi:hypothetical protein